MSIIQSNACSHSVSNKLGFIENIYPWRVRCDYCGKDAAKEGNTAGDAADNARKEGFITVPAKIPALPSKWSCVGCSH